ncbi:MAG: signal peptidase I [Cyanobacteria bacterium P01_H01_bin.152]
MKSDPHKPAESSVQPEAVPESPFWQHLWEGQRENVRILAVALVIAVFLRFVVAEPRFIPSNSMEPTLHVGDRLLVDKVSTRLHPPHFGDIVVFKPPPQLQDYGYSGKQAFIKRVIATAGETVTVTNHQVIVDGNTLREAYTLEPPDYLMGSITVPPGNLFVMGDNRNDSNDSHVWGTLPQDNVIGIARFRFWPLSRFGQVS